MNRMACVALTCAAVVGCAGNTDSVAPPIQGYTDRLSYVAGQSIAFHVSSRFENYHVTVQRIGAEPRTMMHLDIRGGVEHPTPADASSAGCRWPVAFVIDVPADWPSGYYEAYVGAPDPHDPQKWIDGQTMWFVVRAADPGREAPILLQMCTNTYNAYNNFGGQSLYASNSRGRRWNARVSFDRPIPPADVYRWEKPFIQWAEARGYRLEYAVNSDLQFVPGLLDRYKLVLSVGHDEYWSAPMRDALESFVWRGGNAAFFAGNVMCWQVRFEDGGRAMVCWKHRFEQDPVYRPGWPNPTLTTLWASELVNRPPNTFLGVGALAGGYHRFDGMLMDGSGALTVHRPEHWVFAGTGLRRGEEFGGQHKIVGYECDGCEFELRDGRPVPTGVDGTPRDFLILATAPAQWPRHEWAWYEGDRAGRKGAACMGIHRYRGGGIVFTAATTDWANGLAGGDEQVQRITANILDALSR